MSEARKSYMTKEQLGMFPSRNPNAHPGSSVRFTNDSPEQYLADLRNNRPQRPTGTRPISSTAKSRWSLIRSSTTSPNVPDNAAHDAPVIDPLGPPSLHGTRPPPPLSRRESKLLQRHSAPAHKRANTTSSILSFARSPPKPTVEDEVEEVEGWDGVDRQDGRTGDVEVPSGSPKSLKKKRESAPAGTFRGFSSHHGRSHSVSSGSSSSSGSSERKKSVSWKLPVNLDGGPVVMPPCHPLKPADAPKIEKELALHFESMTTNDMPTIAPLRINKSVSSASSTLRGSEPLPAVLERASSVPSQAPSGSRSRENIVPYPRRSNYSEPWKEDPTQNNNPKYTTTTSSGPLTSPPSSVEEEEAAEEAEILKGLGRRPLPKVGSGPSGSRGPTPPEDNAAVRRNNMKYGAQIQPSQPPVIGIVTAPNPPPRATVSKVNSAPSIPTFSFPDDDVPSIRVSGTSPNPPTITVSDRRTPTIAVVPTISVGGPSAPTISVAPPTISTPSDSHNSRPLPQPRSRTSPSSVYSSASTAGGRSRGATVSCNLCRNPIEGRIVSAGSLRFHADCFRCDHCQTSLEHVGFYPEPKDHRSSRLHKAGLSSDDTGSNGTGIRFYCHLDFHELFSPRCKSCKTPIEGEVVVACGSTWHQGHFFCAECGDPFDSSSRFVEKDGYAWCVGCYTKRFSGRCKKCKRPVTETVVKALGGEWHEECFCCDVSLIFCEEVGHMLTASRSAVLGSMMAGSLSGARRARRCRFVSGARKEG